MTEAASAASATLRVIGPICGSCQKAGGYEGRGLARKVGLPPTPPQNAEERGTDPAASVPMPTIPRPDAVAAAAPPLLPPACRSGSSGVVVTPFSGLSVSPFQANSGVVVLPRKTAPDVRRRPIDTASGGAAPSEVVRAPPS